MGSRFKTTSIADRNPCVSFSISSLVKRMTSIPPGLSHWLRIRSFLIFTGVKCGSPSHSKKKKRKRKKDRHNFVASKTVLEYSHTIDSVPMQPKIDNFEEGRTNSVSHCQRRRSVTRSLDSLCFVSQTPAVKRTLTRCLTPIR